MDQPTAEPKAPRRPWRWVGGGVLVLLLAAVVLVLAWDWNWFRPLVEARASAGVGRRVTMERLEVHPGRDTLIVAHGLRVANPEGFEGQPDYATIPRLAVTFAAWTYIRTRRLVLPLVEAEAPDINAIQLPDGRNNWAINIPRSSEGGPAAEVEDVIIRDGHAHVVAARTDLELTIATAERDGTRTLTVDAKGTHADQPITAHAVGGALLALRDTTAPYPIEAELTNGPTKVTLKGTIVNPSALGGADLDLTLAGPDMALLYPLTGIPIPRTPPYKVAGKLGFGDGRIAFTGIRGQVGSTDLAGDLAVDPRPARPVLTGTLASRAVDMEDLAGFIGSEPGRVTTPGQSARQVQAVQRAEADPRLLPTKPINMPKVKAADIHLAYKADAVKGDRVPFNSMAAKLDIIDGHITLTPLRLGIGTGAIVGNFDLNPVGDGLAADIDVKLERLDIGQLLKAAGLGSGAGVINGAARLKGRGNSVSAIAASGDGGVNFAMGAGGSVDALLLDLSGVELGKALLAALDIPDREGIRCMGVDFVLQKGLMYSRVLAMETTDHVITGGGAVDLGREVLELYIRTDGKRFSIGTLATPIRIAGPFKDLRFAPAAELAIRGGAAVGLGVLFPPAALLPTIHFGVGEGSPCAGVKR